MIYDIVHHTIQWNDIYVAKGYVGYVTSADPRWGGACDIPRGFSREVSLAFSEALLLAFSLGASPQLPHPWLGCPSPSEVFRRLRALSPAPVLTRLTALSQLPLPQLPPR